MKISIYRIVCLFVLVSPIKVSSQVPEELDSYLEHIFQNHVIPGFSVVVVKNDRIIYKRAFGKERLDKNKPFHTTTVSAIGSLTKSITAIAVMQLVEKGILSLDEPVVKYLPEFRTANKIMSDKVTVRMLLNNTAGLNADPPATMERSSIALAHLNTSLNKTFLTQEPGISYKYSNTDFSIAGLVINRVTGLSFEDYVSKNIYAPLKMTNSILGVDGHKKQNLLRGHYFGRQPLPANNAPFAISGEYVPAGSLAYATIEDLAHYLIALLNNGKFRERKILTKESVEQLFTPNISFPGLSKNDGGDGQIYRYGLGWMISNIDGREVIHHGGSTGTMSSFTMLDRKNKTATSLLFNLDLTFIDTHKYIPHYSIANNLLHIVNGEKPSSYGIPIRTDPIQNNFGLSSKERGRYLGEYRYSQGGLPWMNFGTSIKVFSNASKMLMAKVFRANDAVGEFKVDLVTPRVAVTRNIAAPEEIRFYNSPQGNINAIQWQGKLYEKRKEVDKLNLFAHDLKDSTTIYLPKNWKFEETEYGFKAHNDTIKSTIIGLLHENKNPLKSTFLEKYQIKSKGLISLESISVMSWKKQSFEIQNKRLLTFFESVEASNKMLVLFNSPASQHTKILSDVVDTIIDGLSFPSIPLAD